MSLILTIIAQTDVYHKLSGKDNWDLIGKCEEGFIFQKYGRKDSGGVVGKYEGCHGESAFLLLLLNQGN